MSKMIWFALVLTVGILVFVASPAPASNIAGEDFAFAQTCFSETAWAAQTIPGETRFIPAPGNWATWITYTKGAGISEETAKAYPLYAGRHYLSGWLRVYDDGHTLYVKYEALGEGDPGDKVYGVGGYCDGLWTGIYEFNLQVEDEFAGFNAVRTYNKRAMTYRNPIPGRFEYGLEYRYDLEYEEGVPDTGWIAVDIEGFDGEIFIAAHAVMAWCASPCPQD